MRKMSFDLLVLPGPPEYRLCFHCSCKKALSLRVGSRTSGNFELKFLSVNQ